MPNDTVTLSAEEYQALIAARAEHDALRGELRRVTAGHDLAEKRLRACKRELFGASSETRDAGELGLFNEAEALAPNADAAPAREDEPAKSCNTNCRNRGGSARTTAMHWARSVSRRANNST